MWPICVQVDAREHQHRHQVGKRDPMRHLVPSHGDVEAAVDRQLQRQGRQQRGHHPHVVEREQRRDARRPAQGLQPQHERQKRRALAPDVALRQAEMGRRFGDRVGAGASGLSLLDRHVVLAPGVGPRCCNGTPRIKLRTRAGRIDSRMARAAFPRHRGPWRGRVFRATGAAEPNGLPRRAPRRRSPRSCA